MSDDAPSFFSRWSRRKAVARGGEASAEPTPATAPALAPASDAGATPAAPAPVAPTTATSATATPAPPAPPLPPTLDDVALLTRDSDYSRFVAGNVSPEVKNAALKQLFTDPHFNVMDGLDIYIGDYNTPDPLPPGMLRQMVQSQLLGLFDHEKEDADKPADDALLPAAAAAAPPAQAPDTTVSPVPSATAALPAPDEDPDLQLQPDDDAGRPGTEPGPGAHAGRPH